MGKLHSSYLTGYHKIKLKNSIKIGNFINGQLRKGIIKYNNGVSYEGIWYKNRFVGIKKTNNNTIYDGEWNKQLFIKATYYLEFRNWETIILCGLAE